MRPAGLPNLVSAIHDFHSARNRAILKEILARLTGESTELLSYEEVRQKLKMLGSVERGLQEIPLKAIVGSVGRYSDFTRDFLPRRSVDETRWARVLDATTGLAGLPPIEVYRIGEAYFVKDGNHRVSVARQLGVETIQAYVTDVRTRVPLTPDVRPDDLILKAEYADFLEKTRLVELQPEADLSVTIPGQYAVLEEHVSVHRYFMGIDQKRPIPYAEAVIDWYDNVYLPLVRSMRESGILRDFPNRSEADLYLWISEHRAALEKALGWQVSPEIAIRDLAEQFGPEEANLMSWFGGMLRNVLPLQKLEGGPPVGQWRAELQTMHRLDSLFTELLVPVNGRPEGWNALEQAIVIAGHEQAQLHGLHMVVDETQAASLAARAVQDEFQRRCAAAGVLGQLTISVGEVAQGICAHSRWVDLIVTNLAYPPPSQPLARLDSGFRDLVGRCPRPLLAVPGTVTPLSRALLAYDGSPKSQEALFVATYLAGKWDLPLTVLAVIESNRVSRQTLNDARRYLETHGISAEYLSKSGPVAEVILRTADARGCDLLLMGGYGYSPVLEVVLGSAVDQVLRTARWPVLLCR